MLWHLLRSFLRSVTVYNIHFLPSNFLFDLDTERLTMIKDQMLIFYQRQIYFEANIIFAVLTDVYHLDSMPDVK